ncbi:MAG: TerB family tellurite resistance protein, partial [Pseudomonadales bacterium]
GRAAPEAEDPRLVPLAAATLLFEVASADQEVAEGELAVVRSALTEQFDLSEEEVRAVMRDSRTQYDESVGLYGFTRTLVDAWDEPKRFDLLVQLWRLALSDARLDRFEEHTIRKIADLLYVSHARFIEAKQHARRLVGEESRDT